jgi:hypothetical protein
MRCWMQRFRISNEQPSRLQSRIKCSSLGAGGSKSATLRFPKPTALTQRFFPTIRMRWKNLRLVRERLTFQLMEPCGR